MKTAGKKSKLILYFLLFMMVAVAMSVYVIDVSAAQPITLQPVDVPLCFKTSTTIKPTTTIRPTTTTTCPKTTTTVKPITTTVMPTTTSTIVHATTSTINNTTTVLITSTTTTVNTTLINLSEFKAIPGDTAVTLKWVTESEVDTEGFNVYRAESVDGQYEQVNDLLISARGSATEGALYIVTDDGLTNRQAYYYKLEDMDQSGKATMHGPVSATPRWIFGLLK